MAKRVLLIMTILVVFSTTAGFAQGSEDWVSDAIKYLSTFDLSTVSSVDPTDRYQVSMLIAQNIQGLEKSNSSRVQRFGVSRDVTLVDLVTEYNTRVQVDQRLPAEYVITLSRLASEFKAELDVLGYNVKLGQFDPYQTTGLTLADIGYSEMPHSNPLSKRFESGEGTERALNISPLLPLKDQIYLSAAFIYPDKNSDEFDFDHYNQEQVTGFAGLSGEYRIMDSVVLQGQYLHSLNDPTQLGLLEVGAKVPFGDVEVGGAFRPFTQGVNTLDDEKIDYGPEFELSLRYGDFLSFTTEVDKKNDLNDDLDDDKVVTTRLNMQYGFPNSLLVSAGYVVNLANLNPESSTSVGVDIPIPKGRLKVGLTQDWNVNPDSSDFSSITETHDRTTTSLGLSYALTNEATLQLNYRLIDFSNVDNTLQDQQTDIGAGFSIRF